jgi:hypothetical protein
MKLGKVCNNLKKYSDAVTYFQEALEYLEGETEKNTVKELLE